MANLEGVFAGNYDAPLTELGYNQAKRTAEFIAENYKVDKVYASDLIRALKQENAWQTNWDLMLSPSRIFAK